MPQTSEVGQHFLDEFWRSGAVMEKEEEEEEEKSLCRKRHVVVLTPVIVSRNYLLVSRLLQQL